MPIKPWLVHAHEQPRGCGWLTATPTAMYFAVHSQDKGLSMMSHAANLTDRTLRLVLVVICTLFGFTSSSAPARAQIQSSPPAANPATATLGTSPSPSPATQAGTPAAAASPSPAASPDRTASARDAEACKKAVAAFGAGDPAAVKSLPPEKQAALHEGAWVEVVSCLAVANDNVSYCESLPKAEMDNCSSDWRVMKKVKTLPKEASALPLVASRLHEQCVNDLPKAVCDQMQEAMATGNSAKCKGLPSESSALCEAVVTGDAHHCLKEGDDCSQMVAIVAKFKKEGLNGFKSDNDPVVLLAARDGKRACAPLLTKLERLCLEGRPGVQ